MPQQGSYREMKKIEYSREVAHQKKLDLNMKTMVSVEKKAARRSFDRRLYIEKTEAAMENALYKAKEGAEMLDFYIKQEENLAHELEQVKLENIRKEKMRQQIRENTEELRVLESKLRAAYVGKTIRAQIAEKESRLVEEKASIFQFYLFYLTNFFLFLAKPRERKRDFP